MESKIETLIAKMERSRGQLNAALDKITAQTEIYPSWKLKQVMDHITGWDELVISALHAYQQGDTPARSVMNIDQYNAGSVSARRALTLEQSHQAFDATRQEVIQTLCELPAAMLSQKFNTPWGGQCTISSIVRIFVSHEQEHAKQIEEVLIKPAISH